MRFEIVKQNPEQKDDVIKLWLEYDSDGSVIVCSKRGDGLQQNEIWLDVKGVIEIIVPRGHEGEVPLCDSTTNFKCVKLT